MDDILVNENFHRQKDFKFQMQYMYNDSESNLNIAPNDSMNCIEIIPRNEE